MWFVSGLVVGATVSYFFWHRMLEICIGEVLEGKRDWKIGGRTFDIVERK